MCELFPGRDYAGTSGRAKGAKRSFPKHLETNKRPPVDRHIPERPVGRYDQSTDRIEIDAAWKFSLKKRGWSLPASTAPAA